MEKVLIWTKAYNAERTIRRTIESVLGQTYENWQYYVLDNGSTDATGTIIRKYVQKDSRIHIQRNDQNIFDAMFDPDDLDCDAFDYIAFLDADDEYKPEFLEKATKFAQTSALDMVMCGSDFINTANGKAAGTRQIGENNLVIEDRDFGQSFSVCFQFYRTYWGKLIRMPLVKQLNVHELPKVTYGLDTIFILALVQKSARVGILGGTLHKYYVSAKSVSYQWHDRRIISDIMLFDVARDFLISKCGSLSPRNEEFLLLVYMNALLDTLRVLLNSNVSDAEKLDALREMFLCEHTKVLAAWEQFGGHFNNAGEHTKRRGELFLAAAQWLLSRKEIADEQIVSYCELGEFLCAACENADGWLFFSNRQTGSHLQKNNKRR
jgi:glycosyltransferase involved in cell wall biosynthesis